MKNHLFILLLLLQALTTAAQEYSKGLILNDDAYNAIPKKATQTRGMYVDIRTSASLKQYCPRPNNQGSHSTCAGWATGYAARTILWAKQQGIANLNPITEHAFSPDFIYRNIVSHSNSNNCESGTELNLALDVLKYKGDILQKDLHPCPSVIQEYLYATASNYRIQDYVKLFDLNDSDNEKVNTVKLSLAQGNPVVIAMETPPSFSIWSTGKFLWTPTEKLDGTKYPPHGVCVVGYDDNKYGGAFEIMNSWGDPWANKGFIWIKYVDFAYWTKQAFELIDNLKPTPPNNPTSYNDYDFSGDLRFVLSNGEEMNALIREVRGLYVSSRLPAPRPNEPQPDHDYFNKPDISIGKLVVYRTQQAYTEGTQFRVYLRNNQPAYVYAIAMDNTNRANVLFPHKPDISPILNYENNEVALPSEYNYITMDNIKGTDVFCLLYSKEPLDINHICRQLEQEEGTFFEKLYKIMQHKLVDRQYWRYYNQRMRFEIKSYGTGTVVPIVVEVPHN